MLVQLPGEWGAARIPAVSADHYTESGAQPSPCDLPSVMTTLVHVSWPLALRAGMYD